MRMPLLAAALLLSGSAAALAADTDTEFRLNELLGADPVYRDTWSDLVRDESRLPEWVINLSGKALPMKAVEDDGDKYLVGQLCETQTCQQRLYVAFSWDKEDVYALYVQVPEALPADKAPSHYASERWLGDPNEQVRTILQEQLKADSDWY